MPESFKFSVPSAQDIMPEMKIRQSEQPKFVQLEWNAIPTARAYFLGSMGALPGGGDEAGMVIWTSSELPDSGFGLFDYQTNSAVDKWLGEKVLLPPDDHEMRGSEGGRGPGHAARDRLRHRPQHGLSAPPHRSEDRVGAGLERQAAREVDDDDDDGNAGRGRNARRGGYAKA